MVRHENERSVDVKKMFGAEGQAKMVRILESPDEMFGKGRIFNHVWLEKDCGIGWHVHHGDGETYYILRGEGEYNDNGTVVTVRAGDVTFVDDGEGHALVNRRDEALEAIALVLYK